MFVLCANWTLWFLVNIWISSSFFFSSLFFLLQIFSLCPLILLLAWFLFLLVLQQIFFELFYFIILIFFISLISFSFKAIILSAELFLTPFDYSSTNFSSSIGSSKSSSFGSFQQITHQCYLLPPFVPFLVIIKDKILD